MVSGIGCIFDGEKARENFASAQKKMTNIYDRRAKIRNFSPGDQVLALLPLVCSPFQTKFHGTFTVLHQVSKQNYLLSTPKRRKSTQLCHVNLLKPYYTCELPFCEHVPQQTVRPVLVTYTVGRCSTAAGVSVQEEDGVVSPMKAGCWVV